MGAVAYDPKVVTIWEGMRRYFHEEARLPVEVVLFQSYETQVEALLALSTDPSPRIDIGWNTNFAFLQATEWSERRCAPIAMRDTDLGWMTKIVAVAMEEQEEQRDLDALCGEAVGVAREPSRSISPWPLSLRRS